MEQEKQQELIFKLGMFERQMNQIQEQMEAVEKGIDELKVLNFGLDELKGSVNKEILSQLGKGIFVKSKVVSEDLTVDIGGGNFVKKSIPDTKEIIEDQIKKLITIKDELKDSLERMSQEMSVAMEEFQK